MMRHIAYFITFAFLMLLPGGCSNAPYRGDDVYGADEFVIDSYKIKEGKLSILEMEGRSLVPFDPELLSEYQDTVENGDSLETRSMTLRKGALTGQFRQSVNQ